MTIRANKNPAQQAVLIMTEKKNQHLDSQLQDLVKKKRKAVSEQNGCCLTCAAVSSKIGIFLNCSFKNKNVRQYNYCGMYVGIDSIPESKESKESKEEN